MTEVLTAQAAGIYYSRNPNTLRTDIQNLLQTQATEPLPGLRALIVPHGSLGFSGLVAASAYAALGATPYERIVVIGPSHQALFDGVAVPEFHSMQSPLGDVPLDVDMLARLASMPFLRYFNDPFRLERSIEMQLPFLQTVANDVPLVPLLIGQTNANVVTTLLEILFDENTLFIISSDLSHFHPLELAIIRDQTTLGHILNLHDKSITSHDACGAVAIRGLMKLARYKTLSPMLLSHDHSAHATQDIQNVVGYASVAFCDQA